MTARWLATRSLRGLIALALTGALAGIGSTEASGSEAATKTCVTWSGAQPVNPTPGNSLESVAALSPCDVWAVGTDNLNSNPETLIEHWTGAAWFHVASPSPGGSHGSFLSAVSSSGGKIWAVGTYFTATVARTLILRWNGSKWVRSPSPNVGSSSNELFSVAGTSPTNAWAVGDYFTGTHDHTLVLHWNGKSWGHVPSPNRVGDNFLDGVAATSARDIWAVGTHDPGVMSSRTLIEHWNGKSWSLVSSPNRGSSFAVNSLHAVAATSARNAWAVGSYTNLPPSRTLILHWNGRVWRAVSSPNEGGARDNFLSGIAATSAGDAWAVGYRGLSSSFLTLIENWNGKSWSVVPSPNLGISNQLIGAAASSGNDIWAVGTDYDGSAILTFAVHCC